MSAAFTSSDETGRVRDLRGCAPEGDGDALDGLTRLAATVAAVPMAAVRLADTQHQWRRRGSFVGFTPFPCDEAAFGQGAFERRTVICTDTRLDARFADRPMVRTAPHVRFYASIALASQRGAVWGALVVMDTVPRELTDSQLESLSVVARQIVDHLELREAQQELRQLREQARGFERRLQAEKMEEARLLAAELHDGVGQELVGISMLLTASLRAPAGISDLRRTVEEALPLLSSAVDTCRRVAEGHGAFLLRGEGIVGALQRYVRGLRRPGVRFQFEGTSVPAPCLGETEGYQLFGIAREAITNACRHSGGDVVRVRCEHGQGHIGVIVEDNGAGTTAGTRGGQGLGRKIMEYRARAIGAQLSVRTLDGGGLSVECRLPCRSHGRCSEGAQPAESP